MRRDRVALGVELVQALRCHSCRRTRQDGEVVEQLCGAGFDISDRALGIDSGLLEDPTPSSDTFAIWRLAPFRPPGA